LFHILRYRKDDAINYNYVDVTPQGTDSFEVQDLKVGTKYTFSIMAFNIIGSSDFTPDIGKVETKSMTFKLFILYYYNIKNPFLNLLYPNGKGQLDQLFVVFFKDLHLIQSSP